MSPASFSLTHRSERRSDCLLSRAVQPGDSIFDSKIKRASLMQRRQFLKSTSVALAATLSGCGGGDSGGAAASNASPLTPTPAPGPAPTPAPAPAPAPGSAASFGNLPTLTLHPTQNVVGPYTAAVFPLQGLVPSGQGIDSPDDPAMRSTVISRWPDGSASVVVVAGETSVSLGAPKQIRLRAAAAGSTPLTPARVAQLVSNVTVNCGAVGSATFDNLATPSKVWWANERVICCRYRAPIGTHPTLEAVVDIHAFSSNQSAGGDRGRELQDVDFDTGTATFGFVHCRGQR